MIDTDGELYACGKKDMVLSKYDEIEPISLEFFYNKKLSGICAAEEHSIALTVEGDCFVWGVNKYGKIGNNSENQPQNSPFKLELPNSILEISSRINHNVVLTHSGDIYVWGCGSGGRLGFGSTNNVLTPKHLETR